MNIYPVIITTVNRYEHFKRCVESLARNTHANKTELVIGLDYPPSEKYEEGYKKIKAYIPTITGFRKITVFERDENYGAEANFAALLSYSFEHNDAVISTEDDNEFSPCFLDFMNKALEKYKEDNNVLCVEGENNIKYLNLIQSNIMFAPTGGGRGLGFWKQKEMPFFDNSYPVKLLNSWEKSWDIFKNYPGMLQMLLAMVKNGKELWGDVLISCKNITEGTLQLRPRRSMVRNHGYDGSGLHSGVNLKYARQLMEYEIENTRVFELENIETKCDPKIKKAIYWHLLPNNRFLALLNILKILCCYIRYRIVLCFKK